MNIVLCVLAVSIVAGVVYVWNDRFRRLPLTVFGIENVQCIGTWGVSSLALVGLVARLDDKRRMASSEQTANSRQSTPN
ncbi:hypothetical protein [Paraburkholderia tuberum]|uniref:Uncharacterized protein n=1 Tax=Paraburkholderia tuberum TaxID=157910 RepID=A0A1H1KJJ6_9BURK|nr:hypothetical protein [Paraburkholderia tuberum]SDR62531.1 hypothetical protein SAMN05445850_8247 [Paraburkholderia tuberum]